MLTKLRIQNFALIEDATIDFLKPLIVFSGETGSGKSMLVNALNFLIGEKKDKSFIRYEKDFMQVDGIFRIDKQTAEICMDLGIETNNELLLSRKIFVDGKNEIRANGNIITLSMLKIITKNLVDIYGQHQHQSLLNESCHLKFVDAFSAPEELFELREVVSSINKIKSKLSEFGGDQSSRQRDIDIANFELNELEEANLTIGEDESLLEKQKMFLNVQKVADAINQANNFLVGNEDYSIDSCLCGASKSLGYISNIENGVASQIDRLSHIMLDIEDVRESLVQILEKYDFSQQEFEETEARLSVIKNIKRKYGGMIESAIEYRDNLKEKLAFLQNGEEECEKLQKEKEKLESVAWELCSKITQKRKQNATILEEKIIAELKTLGMNNSNFVVEFTKLDDFSSNGCDSVRFLFSANMGEPLKPLSNVISGGEMSRFMLAFKAVMGNKNGVPTMLFDEIDNGISGEIGFQVGCKLSQISKQAQVIVITHLASIGSMADQHFKVEKKTENNRTYTKIKQLNDNEQLLEIARLAGGMNGGFANDYARQLKQRAISAKI